MLTVLRAVSPRRDDDAFFAALRADEFPSLDEQRFCYLDYTGAALPARSHLDSSHALLRAQVLGNPHSAHAASRRSTDAIDRARMELLALLDADPNEYDVCFTANASAAIKLVAESFRFDHQSTLVLSADNHNSVNGVREYARRAGARVRTVLLTPDLRLRSPRRVLAMGRGPGARLFAFPAQSNFSGVHHPLTLVGEAQKLGYQVLVDAAAYLPAHTMSLRRVKPEFIVVSLYKLFGYPTGVGALVARRDALARLRRPWFAGGTVDWVSVRHGVHRMRPSIEGFEDGTANFMGIASLQGGFDFFARIGMPRLTQRVQYLTDVLLCQLLSRRHANGSRAFIVYGPHDLRARGGTVAFNLLNASGQVVHYEHVEAHAADRGVAVRGGCFCNPGASEAAFGFPADRLSHCLAVTANEPFTPRKLADCLGGNVAVGAIRASVGLANSEADLLRGVDVLAETVGM